VPVLLIVLLALAVGVLAYVAWISLQSLFQARVLLEGRRHAAGGLRAGDRVALYGAPRIERRLGGAWSGCLWYRCRHQVLRRSGKNSRWITVDEEGGAAEFSVETPAGAVRVADAPTEVQALESRTDYGEPGCLGVFHTSGDTRTASTWLSIPPRVTVVGRLDGGGEKWFLFKDGKVGLLLSPLEPGSAAGREIAKGLLGLLVVTAAVSVGLWFYFQNRGPGW
jgi:hypothetical protein